MKVSIGLRESYRFPFGVWFPIMPAMNIGLGYEDCGMSAVRYATLSTQHLS